MLRIVLGLAALPVAAGVALAQPMRLSDRQMDAVTAGETLQSFLFDPAQVPGSALIAKVEADQLLGVVVSAYLALVNPRLGPPAPP